MPPYQFTTADGTLAGPINGSNSSFTLTPFPKDYSYSQPNAAGLLLFRNGVMQDETQDFTPGNGLLTLAIPLAGSDILTGMFFLLSGPGQDGASLAPTKIRMFKAGSIVFGGTFTLPAPVPFVLFKNGIALTPGLDYSASGRFITPSGTVSANDQWTAVISIGGTFCSTFAGTITGTINGSNLIFSLPSPPQSLMLFRNGILMTAGLDFTISGSTVTFSISQTPQTGDVISSQIWAASGPIQTSSFNGGFTQQVAQTSWLTRNGLYMTQSQDGTVVGDIATLAFPQTPKPGDIVTVEAWIADPSGNEPPLNTGTQYSSADGSITGTMNGQNNLFTIPAVPLAIVGNGTYVAVTGIEVWWNGISMTQGIDFSFSGNQISMMNGQYPRAGDTLTAVLFYA